MEFGRVYDSLTNIDFSLPPDMAVTRKTLDGQPAEGAFSVFVGASKWGEKSWLGKIYPKKTPDNSLLPIYCRNFNTVEFGPTFYNIYSAEQITKWASQVTAVPAFRFCPKFPQTITHIRRLTNAEDPTSKFYQSLTRVWRPPGPLAAATGR